MANAPPKLLEAAILAYDKEIHKQNIRNLLSDKPQELTLLEQFETRDLTDHLHAEVAKLEAQCNIDMAKAEMEKQLHQSQITKETYNYDNPDSNQVCRSKVNDLQ